MDAGQLILGQKWTAAPTVAHGPSGMKMNGHGPWVKVDGHSIEVCDKLFASYEPYTLDSVDGLMWNVAGIHGPFHFRQRKEGTILNNKFCLESAGWTLSHEGLKMFFSLDGVRSPEILNPDLGVKTDFQLNLELGFGDQVMPLNAIILLIRILN